MTEERGSTYWSIKRENKKNTSLDFSDKGRNLHKINGEKSCEKYTERKWKRGKRETEHGSFEFIFPMQFI